MMKSVYPLIILFNTGASNQINRSLSPTSGPRLTSHLNFQLKLPTLKRLINHHPDIIKLPLNYGQHLFLQLIQRITLILLLYHHHTLFHLRGLKRIFPTFQFTQLIKTKILLLVLNELFMVLEKIPPLNNNLPCKTFPISVKLFSRSPHSAIDIDDTPESDGIVNVNRSLGLGPAKKTKENNMPQKPYLEVTFVKCVRFTCLFFHLIQRF